MRGIILAVDHSDEHNRFDYARLNLVLSGLTLAQKPGVTRVALVAGNNLSLPYTMATHCSGML